MLNRKVSKELERRYGPVEAHFTITQTPEGNAPQGIREQWVDVALPVRRIHVARFLNGYIGRRFLPVPENSTYVDAISGEPPKHYNQLPVEVRGWDAIESLREAKRDEAAEYWLPYAMAMLSFRHYEGTFDGEVEPADES